MYARHFKRPIDVVISGLVLAVLSPALGLIAFLIRMEDRGPVFFRQKRVGRDGELFELIKFRTMPADTADVPKAAATTLRITRVGRPLRRLNLDELPQLLNILRGDMSIVGPRPALPSQENLCRLRIEYGAASVLPGLTGLAQINAYDGMPDEEKARWDAEYSRNITFARDLAIILRTFSYLRRPPPVY